MTKKARKPISGGWAFTEREAIGQIKRTFGSDRVDFCVFGERETVGIRTLVEHGLQPRDFRQHGVNLPERDFVVITPEQRRTPADVGGFSWRWVRWRRSK